MKILLVEDDRAVRKMLIDALGSQGYEVKAAADGCSALDKFSKFMPDLVLSDIRMPCMSGLELLREVREMCKETIVVLMTAFAGEEYLIEALRLGVNNYLQKPLRLRELFQLLRKYASLVDARTVEREIQGMIERRSLTMKIDNDLGRVPSVVDRLMRETADMIEADARLGVHLGLAELIINAIEHGNLEIGYEEKAAALESDAEALWRLYDSRLANPELAARRVTIDFAMDRETGCAWKIADEGKGFDWKALPDPTRTGNRMALHGRGIFISRMHFDELSYHGAGNVAHVVKRAKCDAEAPAAP